MQKNVEKCASLPDHTPVWVARKCVQTQAKCIQKEIKTILNVSLNQLMAKYRIYLIHVRWNTTIAWQKLWLFLDRTRHTMHMAVKNSRQCIHKSSMKRNRNENSGKFDGNSTKIARIFIPSRFTELNLKKFSSAVMLYCRRKSKMDAIWMGRRSQKKKFFSANTHLNFVRWIGREKKKFPLLNFHKIRIFFDKFKLLSMNVNKSTFRIRWYSFCSILTWFDLDFFFLAFDSSVPSIEFFVNDSLECDFLWNFRHFSFRLAHFVCLLSFRSHVRFALCPVVSFTRLAWCLILSLSIVSSVCIRTSGHFRLFAVSRWKVWFWCCNEDLTVFLIFF